jgi:hypothetical protein
VETTTPTSLILLSNHAAKTRRLADGMELVYGIIIAVILSLKALLAAIFSPLFAAMYCDVHSSNVCKKQELESINVIQVVTSKEDQVVVTALYLAAIMLSLT